MKPRRAVLVLDYWLVNYEPRQHGYQSSVLQLPNSNSIAYVSVIC
jgi:hypothetical protein